MTVDVAQEIRICRACQEPKPVTEFYEKGDGNRQPICRDCDNARPRTRTISKMLRVRARHRATAELIRRYRAEFDHLLEYFTDVVTQEAELIDEAARAAHGEGGVPRLRPGQRRKGQEALDRINEMWIEVGKCQDCTSHHKHGHACVTCGAAASNDSQMRAIPLPEQRGTCVCAHPARRHDLDGGCLISDCVCSGYPDATEESA